VPGSASSRFSSLVGRGVVVTSCRGRSPSRSPNCSMSQAASALLHFPSSSHQAAANCGPRNRSGSEAPSTIASTPFIQCRAWPVSTGRSSGGWTASTPDGPRTITSMPSIMLWLTSAIGVTPAMARPRTH
jgi:hypothetical protein